MKLPIVSRHQPEISQSEIDRSRKLAQDLLTENHQFELPDEFRELTVTGGITDEPVLHLDDFSEIPVIGKNDDSRALQQRARIRACDGDWVVQSRMIERGFSDYFEYDLGLGRVKWFYPAVKENNPRQIALACIRDRRLRHDLEHALRHEGLRYIHPHVSNRNVWQLAAHLHQSTRMPISVIGPSPALAAWANDKIEFTQAVERLFGQEFVPHTEVAYNFATLSKIVARLAATHQKIGIKYPYGTGGHGNFLFDSRSVRGRSLRQVRGFLKQQLYGVRWPKKGRVLVDVWQTNVINSPSVQTWIPPLNCGEPIIEGVFVQTIADEQGHFVGSAQSNLPNEIEQQIVNQGFLLATLFQHLGYVGRCSFDLILIGQDLSNCRLEFIECNARWGGTSGPMTLANRIGLGTHQRYCVRRIDVADLWQMEFAELQRELKDTLYLPTTGQGHLVLFNPARIKEQSAIDVIVIAPSHDEVQEWVAREIPDRLAAIAAAHRDPNALTGFLLSHAEFDDAGLI